MAEQRRDGEYIVHANSQIGRRSINHLGMMTTTETVQPTTSQPTSSNQQSGTTQTAPQAQSPQTGAQK